MMRIRRSIPVSIVAALAALALSIAFTAPAQPLLSEPPPDMAAADIVERRGETVALEAQFIDHTGAAVRFGDLFDGERPVVLVLSYFTCPIVCPLVLNNAQKAFNELSWTLGEEYQVVTVSFDHRDTARKARSYRDAMLAGVENASGDNDWPFLTGGAESIRALCDSVGWKYKFLPETGDFSHPTAIIILSPEGAVSNYLYGVSYKERQLRLALVDASDGKVGDVFDRILLRCYHYDPNAGSYVLAAQRVMTIGAVLTMVLLGGVISGLVMIDRRRTRRARARTHDVNHWTAEVSEA